jgi:hypothetical protein
VTIKSAQKRGIRTNSAVKADPSQWSKQSRQSYAVYGTKEYVDIQYFCWHCGKRDVFTADDQKYSFEVKKNYIWQQRILCQDCWGEANRIRKGLDFCQEKWLKGKTVLQNDVSFLRQWLQLLQKLEEYIPYKPDTARKNMLTKLIGRSE